MVGSGASGKPVALPVNNCCGLAGRSYPARRADIVNNRLNPLFFSNPLALGQHTDEVLPDLVQLNDTELAKFVKDGVV